MKRHAPHSSAQGLTLTELLVVLAIISLLATILLPTVVNKMEQARIAVAKQETREIAQGEEQCASIHGYYVPFQVLDDLNPNAFGAPGSAVRPPYGAPDILSDENLGNVLLINPNRSLVSQYNAQLTLNDRGSVSQVEKMYEYWAGPFLQFRRFYNPNPNPDAEPEQPYVRDDFPLDPWGQPYRFYSPYGLIGDGADKTDNWVDGDFNGRLTTRFAHPDIQDHFAVVSFGPNRATQGIGSADAITESDEDRRKDDIIYSFGGMFTESSFRAFY